MISGCSINRKVGFTFNQNGYGNLAGGTVLLNGFF